MARFNLYLLERPRRWTDALRERVRSAATPSSREAVEAFLSGTSEGPVLLAADDNPAKVTALWEQCHRDGLAVCIFDHSTVWDRLRDRLRALRGSPARPPVTPAAAPPPAPSPRREETALRDPGAFALGPRARAVVLAVGAFVTLVAVAASVVPEAVREASERSAQTSDLPGGGGRGSLRASTGQGNAAAARGATQNGLAQGADTDAHDRDGRDVTAPRAEVTATSGDAATEPPQAHPARLLAAFVIGVALAWIAGLTLSKRADPAHLRSGGMVMLAFCALVVLTAGVSRLAAMSSAPTPDAPLEEAPPEALPEALPGDARAPEALGPFARLLRRHRGLAAPPSQSLRSLLSHWRTSHSDAGAPHRPRGPRGPHGLRATARPRAERALRGRGVRGEREPPPDLRRERGRDGVRGPGRAARRRPRRPRAHAHARVSGHGPLRRGAARRRRRGRGRRCDGGRAVVAPQDASSKYTPRTHRAPRKAVRAWSMRWLS